MSISPSAVIFTVDTFVDYYELLHVQHTAPTPVIKASYRAMMQKLNHHPDRGGDVAFAQLLNKAEQTLCNPQTRALYDLLRQQQLSQANSRHADNPATDGFSWGAPGGSPDTATRTDSKPDKSDDEAAARSSTSQAGEHSNTASTTADSNLPAPPQCPFCQTPHAGHPPSPSVKFGYTKLHRCRTCNGAATSINQLPAASNDELRRMHRQLHHCAAHVWLQWPTSWPANSTLNDFSPGGCALLYPNALPIGQIIMIETELFNAICSIRYCKVSESAKYKIGLEFLTLDMLANPGVFLDATA